MKREEGELVKGERLMKKCRWGRLVISAEIHGVRGLSSLHEERGVYYETGRDRRPRVTETVVGGGRGSRNHRGSLY